MVAMVGSMKVAFEANLRKFEAGLKRGDRAVATTTTNINRRVGNASTAFTGLDQRVNSLAASFTRVLAPALAGLGFAQVTRFARTTISDMSGMAKAIDRVGLSAEAFQTLEYGFARAGVSQNEFRTGMERFVRSVGEAEMGTGRFGQILEANGIALRDSGGQMRSTESLLRDYADLVKNAGSEQEAMTLATQAFGRGGAAFVNAIKNGSDGFDDMADAIARAGGTIDDELLRKAEKIDDEFGDLWRQFEINAKRAILNVTTTLREGLFSEIRQTGDALRDLVNDPSWRNFSRFMLGDERAGDILGRGPDDRIRDAFAGDTPGRDAGFERLLRQRYGIDQPTTRLPGGGGDGDSESRAGSRDRAARAAIREMEAVTGLIDQLQFELDLMGMTEQEKARANALRQAGSAATGEQREQILALVDAIEREAQAQQTANEQLRHRRDMVEGAMRDTVRALRDGEMSWERLGDIAIRVLDHIVDKLLTDVMDALFDVNKAMIGGGGGVFGLLGGLLGGGGSGPITNLPLGVGLYHQGGDVGDPPSVRQLPRFHSGRAGVGHGELMAILEDTETVMTKGQVGRTADVLRASTENMKTGGQKASAAVDIFLHDDGTIGAIARQHGREGGAEAAEVRIKQFSSHELPGRVQQISRNPRRRG